MPPAIDLEHLSLDEGGHLLVARALAGLRAGESLEVRGYDPALPLVLGAWCRTKGHRIDPWGEPEEGRHRVTVHKGEVDDLRWSGAVRAGSVDAPSAVADRRWGLAARGALVEEGGPALDVAWVERDHVWADIAPTLYARAAASQWDPATVIDWTPEVVPDDIEDAVVQIMTYLVENEQAALMIPARMLASLHPHYREVMQLLASQVADEARHVEIFTRRALVSRDRMGTSSVAGRASLQTLLNEPDFTLASFLLSVLGEGTFVDLLQFLHTNAPDRITADVTRLAARDEARHVVFGVAHTTHLTTHDPAFLGRLRGAIERRHDALREASGLNESVYDALVLLAAGSWEPAAISRGWRAVQELQARMDQGRRRRLAAIGFPDDEAAELSALHTRNFM
ncbi:hypothetical protein GCM10028801_24820 [Nocardioides maradonensis]